MTCRMPPVLLVQVHERDLYKQKWAKTLVWVLAVDLYKHLIDEISSLLDDLKKVKRFAQSVGLVVPTVIPTFIPTSKSGKKTGKSREKILQLLKAHPNYSARKLAEIIGITPKAIEKHLARLKAEGFIKREGPDKGGSWIVQ